MVKRKFNVIGFCALLVLSVVCASGAEPKLNPQFVAWLNAQTNIQSWSADFVQTRNLKAVVQPLLATGHAWFAAPNQFRWEVGNPPQTIAVRAPSELIILYPKLKRAELFPLTGNQTGQWRDALSLLEAGFPRNQAEVEAKYNVISQAITNNQGEAVLQPKSEAARRMIPQLKVVFDTQKNVLLATEMQFADGSTMRNDFSNPVLNHPIAPTVFSAEIPKEYKVSEPLNAK
jgi:outer membrane lipoprotein-sorting protein